MENYTIYCTEEQTKKALELGAPIDYVDRFNEILQCELIEFTDINGKKRSAEFVIPTAEQMISWLEQNTLFKCIQISVDTKPTNWMCAIYYGKDGCIALDRFSSRKEATIAAIDAALEYLENK